MDELEQELKVRKRNQASSTALASRQSHISKYLKNKPESNTQVVTLTTPLQVLLTILAILPFQAAPF